MKKFILVSAFIEFLAGTILFFCPQLIPDLSQGLGSHMAIARMYGAAALGLGVIAYYTWRNFENTALVKAFLAAFLVFNLGAFIGILSSFLAGVFANPAGAMLHLILGVFTSHYFINVNFAHLGKWKKGLWGLGIALGTLGVLLMLLPNILQQAGLHPDYKEGFSQYQRWADSY